VSDNNLNKKFFTEADSPVPLLPADMAWHNMLQKLDEPEEKKRRFIILIPPFVWVLLIGAGLLLWLTQQNTTVTTKHAKHTIVGKEPGNVTKNISTTQQIETNTSQPKSSKDIYTFAPTLTAQSQNKRSAHAKHKSDEQLRTVKENATGGNDERSLPFAFPERVTFTDPISVQAHQPLTSLVNTPKEDSVSKAVWVEAGLQWNIPAPVNGNDHYLSGPNGKDQPWQYLLPGIWLSVNKNKQRIIVSANAYISAPLPNKYYGGGSVPIQDSMSVYGQKRMVKMFGYQTSLQYGYKLADHWWLSGGISANWWKKGLVSAHAADSISTFKPFLYSVNINEESAVNGFQMNANAALSYQFKACEAILQLNAPFNKTIKNVQSPIWIRVGVRWRLTPPMAHPLPH
jgi:flagellar basal body-associated protein FliL